MTRHGQEHSGAQAMAPSDDAAPAPLQFSAAEWLLLFAEPPAAAPSPLPPAKASEDAAAAVRAATPLHLVPALAPSPGLPLLVRLDELRAKSISPAAYQSGVVAFSLLRLVLCASVFALNDGRFGTRQMAAGLVAYSLLTVLTLVAIPLRGLLFVSSVKDPATSNRHVLAGLARYLQAVVQRQGAHDAGEDNALPEKECGTPAVEPRPDSILLRHDLNDPLCPCPADKCAGRIPRLAGAAAFATSAFWLSASIFSVVASFWTSVVTFAPRTWPSAWAVAMIPGLLLGFSIITFITLESIRWRDNPFALMIEHRLHRRAAGVAFADLLDRCSAASSRGAPLPPSADELYISLHFQLAATWRGRMLTSANYRATIVPMIAIEIVAVCINLAAGSCATGISIIYLATWIGSAVQDLVHAALWNAQVDSILGLYAEIRERLRMLPPSEGLRAHCDLLGSFLEASRLSATVFGVPSSFNLLRASVVSLATVGFAMYGLFRGSGFFATMEVVCPYPGWS